MSHSCIVCECNITEDIRRHRYRAEIPPPPVKRVFLFKQGDYVGRHIRLACKALKVDGDRVTVEASDGGQATVMVPNSEVIESDTLKLSSNPTTVHMLACVNLGSDLDMKLVNDTIEMIHGRSKMFC